jgi:CO/xanthine dehydrogenase Mo-binding subunit
VLRAAADGIGWPNPAAGAAPRGGDGAAQDNGPSASQDGAPGAPPGGGPGVAWTGTGIALGMEKDGRVATAARVQVAPDGTVRLLRLVTAVDCGTVVNPDGLANQVEGAVVMGLGPALFEQIDFTGTRIRNGSMTDYRVPRLADVPPDLEVLLLDQPEQPSAGGGEAPIIAVAPAIANAIFRACGVRLRSMPLVPSGRVPGLAR